MLYGYVMSGPCRKLVRCLIISFFQIWLGALCCSVPSFSHDSLILSRSPDVNCRVNFKIWSPAISYMSWGLCVSEGNCRGYADSPGSEALLWCPEVFDYPTTVNITVLWEFWFGALFYRLDGRSERQNVLPNTQQNRSPSPCLLWTEIVRLKMLPWSVLRDGSWDCVVIDNTMYLQ